MYSKDQNRIALSIFFFLSGFCFSTWASRIPTLKATFFMDEATLGNFLFILPISSLLGLPFSGWLVSKFDSRQPLKVGFVFFLLGLLGIGLSSQFEALVLSAFLFAFSMRVINISMNTQAIQLQKQFTKKDKWSISWNMEPRWTVRAFGFYLDVKFRCVYCTTHHQYRCFSLRGYVGS